ncbi:MAG: GNAT family N-acetyltransferase [Alphaproteobacteria bacterium]|nr:GNAT family N-acetyltransferase [Alphaproteobacteria bacterium]
MALTPDPWLSGILGKPAYHLTDGEFVAPGGKAFVDTKVPEADHAGVQRLQNLGFAVMDINVQFTRPAGPLHPSQVPVRAAVAGDEAGVRALAADAFVFDRFHRDPAIGRVAACRVKAEWAGNYFAGKRGDRMIVADDEAGICGFLQLLRARDGGTIIDLVAVAGRSRGQGIARAMIAQAANAADTGSMMVGTQIANQPSIALYQSLGFARASTSHVLHFHKDTT